MQSQVFLPALWSLEPDIAEHLNSAIQGTLHFDSRRGFTVETQFGCLFDNKVVDGVVCHSTKPFTADYIYGLAQNGKNYILALCVPGLPVIYLVFHMRQFTASRFWYLDKKSNLIH